MNFGELFMKTYGIKTGDPGFCMIAAPILDLAGVTVVTPYVDGKPNRNTTAPGPSDGTTVNRFYRLNQQGVNGPWTTTTQQTGEVNVPAKSPGESGRRHIVVSFCTVLETGPVCRKDANSKMNKQKIIFPGQENEQVIEL